MAKNNDFIRHTSSSQDRKARDASRDAGYRKAAQLLILIGEDAASGVLQHLTTAEAEAVSREIAGMGIITDSEARAVLEEFGYMIRADLKTQRGGEDQALAMLTRALGSGAAEQLLARVRSRTPPSFQFMEDVDAGQAAAVLSRESVMVLATILSQLSPGQAAAMLVCLPAERQAAIAARIARMTRLSPDALHRIKTALADRIKTRDEILTHSVDGPAILLNVVRHLDPISRKKILQDLEDTDPELAASVQEGLFGLETVLQIPGRELEGILRDTPDADLVLVLKGKSQEIKNALLGAVSARRRQVLESDYQAAGAVRRTDVDEVTAAFLQNLRDRWERGEIVLDDGTEEIVS